MRDVYRPLLARWSGAGLRPVTLHVSGPLLDWLEAHDAGYLDLIGRLAIDGRVELLLAGFYEPILAALPPGGSAGTAGWMREATAAAIRRRARGLWLTERVWEPDLAADLHDGGVGYALVDDRHFLVTGIERAALHRPSGHRARRPRHRALRHR